MTLRELVLRLHRWVGLTIGVVVWALCLSGAILLISEPASSAALHRTGRVTPGGGAPVPASALVSAGRAAFPDRGLLSIELYADPTRAALLRFRGGGTVMLDPWTGDVLEAHEGGGLSETLTSLHTRLAAGAPGRAVVAAATTAFVLSVLLGIWLWWPSRGGLRRALTIKARMGWKRLNHDVHNVFGFYAALLLLVLGGSGMLLSFPRLMNLGERAAARVLPAAPPEARPADPGAAPSEEPADPRPLVDRALAHAVRLYPDAPWRRATVMGGAPLRFRVSVGMSGRFDRSHTLRVSPQGALLGVVEYGSEPAAQRFSRFINQLHTGRIGGGYPVAAFVACAVGTILPVTGFLIWFPRWRRKRARSTRDAKGTDP